MLFFSSWLIYCSCCVMNISFNFILGVYSNALGSVLLGGFIYRPHVSLNYFESNTIVLNYGTHLTPITNIIPNNVFTVISFDKYVFIIYVPPLSLNGIHYLIMWVISNPPCIPLILNVLYCAYSRFVASIKISGNWSEMDW